MDRKRKQLDLRAFLSAKRVNPPSHAEAESKEIDLRDEVESVAQAEDNEEVYPKSVSGTSVAASSSCSRNQSDCGNDASGSIKEILMKTNDIAFAVGLPLKQEERYQLLKHKWKPTTTFEFPAVQIGEKKRKFKADWLGKQPWLVYSPSKNGGFCLFCVLFCTSKLELGAFVIKPWARFDRPKEEFTNHSSTKYHLNAAEKSVEFKRNYEKGNAAGVIALADRRISKNVKKNRECLLPIVKTILFCGRNELAFRGHRDDGEIISPEANLACLQGTQGTFRGLLAFRMDAGDSILQQHLSECSKKTTMISKTIQNELIEVIGQHIQSEIVHKILKAKFYSVLVDETSDCSKTEQMSVCIRYVNLDTFSVHEDFVGFSDVTDTTGLGLKTALCSFLDSAGLDLANCRGQGFDGGSNMSGKFKGLQALILKDQPKALFTHCFSHDLNLSVSKACEIQLVKNTIGTVATVSAFLSASPQRVDKFQRLVESSNIPDTQRRRIRPFCPTRWVERHESLLTFRLLLEQILETLEEIQQSGDTHGSHLAFAYESALKRTDFIMTLESLCHVMSFTKTLSVSLQSPEIDLGKAVEQVQTTIKALKEIRTNARSEFNAIYEKASKLGESLGVILTVPRVAKRQNYRHNNQSSSPEEYYYEAVFLKLLDHYIADLNRRFSAQARDVFSLQGLIPTRLSEYSNERILVGAKFYAEDLNLFSFQDLRGELMLWRAKWNGQKDLPSSALEAISRCDEITPNILTLLQIFVTMPVTTCSVERSFSTLKRLKTASRSTMLEPRLNGIALMSVHKKIHIDEKVVIEKFGRAKPRRLELNDLSVEPL